MLDAFLVKTINNNSDNINGCSINSSYLAYVVYNSYNF